MQDTNNTIMETALQPFIKLAQNNMELVKSFSQLPEVNPSVAGSNGQNPFLQGQTSAASLLQSNAFLNLMQGAVKNYTEFVVALGQNSIAAVGQTQASLVREGKAVAENVVDATEARRRRAAQEA
jgi:hypothetical protein